MKTSKLTGFFRVREFGTNRLKNDDETIVFSALMESVPDVLASHAREYTNKNNEKRYAVDFKLTKGTRWFNKFAKPCDRPTNESLENNRAEAVLDYKEVIATEKYNKEKGKFNANGLYVNNIMYNLVEANPFEGEAFADEVEPAFDNNDGLPF